jgi:hypothetical protein
MTVTSGNRYPYMIVGVNRIWAIVLCNIEIKKGLKRTGVEGKQSVVRDGWPRRLVGRRHTIPTSTGYHFLPSHRFMMKVLGHAISRQVPSLPRNGSKPGRIEVQLVSETIFFQFLSSL